MMESDSQEEYEDEEEQWGRIVYASQIGEVCDCGCGVCSDECENCKGLCHAKRCGCPDCNTGGDL